MIAKGITPILNVSSLEDSFAWFGKLGWKKCWDWSATPDGPRTFGAVGSGTCEVFLCRDGQGGRGRGGGVGDEGRGAWMSIWVDDVDDVHRTCTRQGIAVLRPPKDETWGCREMHIQHPDGHVFRIAKGIDDGSEDCDPPKQ